LFPNPGNDQLTIGINGFNRGKYIFTFCDVSGKIILKEEIDVKTNFYKKEINTSILSDGVYFLQISGEELSVVKKWVKTK
jgi:hypothetical protein